MARNGGVGWLSSTTASMVAHVLVEQVGDGLRGDVCEAPAATIEIIQQSSLELERLGFLSGRFRFISIDGGHTAAVVVNDLRLAERTLLAGGVTALDDILNHDWTGVPTGFAAYVASGGALVPFALVPNKLLLTTDAAAAARGRETPRRHFPLALSRPGLDFVGGIVDSYVEHPYYGREDSAGLRLAFDDLHCEHAAPAARFAALRGWKISDRGASTMRRSPRRRATPPG